MFGRRHLFCISTSHRFYRYLCYLLFTCSVIISIADFLCSRRHVSPSYHELQPRDSRSRTHQASKGDCFGFSATLERLEKVATELDSAMRRRFQISNMARYQTGDSTHGSNPLKNAFRYNVVLMAYKRSGSSFVGQIFNRHPSVLYLYEPIYFVKALERHHGNIYRILSRHLLRIIFSCRFQENPYFVSQLSDSPFRLYSRALSEEHAMCPKRSGSWVADCKRLDVKSLIDICQSRRHVVLKSIRIEDLNEVKRAGEPNIEDPWNILKIVHLVRDPRAIISSRAHIDSTWLKKNWTANDYKSNARGLCTKMLKDLKSGTSRDYNGMYNVIRYEDIITHQECAMRDLFKFTGLSKSDEVLQWLRNNSKKSHSEYAFSTHKNITVAMNRWRKHNDLSIIRTIEQECSIIMDLLGYTKVKDKFHLLDFSKPLFRRNTCPSIFITKTINDNLSETIKLNRKGLL